MHLINRLFDLISLNHTHAQRYFTIILLSAVSAVIFMVIFKKTSNQAAIRKEKGKIVGHLLQIRLYKDYLSIILSSIFNILKHNLLYIRHTLPPLLFIIVPLMLITIQINQRCGYTPLQAEDEFIISARVDGLQTLDAISCRATAGIELMTPVVRIPEEMQAFWRAKIKKNAGSDESVALYAADHEVGRKSIAAIAPLKRFLPQIIQADGIEALLYPAEGFLPDNAPIEQITISYARSGYDFLWIGMDAIILYFVLTLLIALIVKPFFKVVI